jgi:hypothetical protein
MDPRGTVHRDGLRRSRDASQKYHLSVSVRAATGAQGKQTMTTRHARTVLATLLLFAIAQSTGATSPAGAAGVTPPGDASSAEPWPIQIAQNFQNPRELQATQGFRVVNVVATHSRKCLDVRGAGLANGTAIQRWDCVGRQQTHQVFRLR